MVHFSKKNVISIPKMWELPQITILRTNSKIVGAHTFRKLFLVFLRPAYVK
ncbi:hypothetical protein LEP1GSC173_2294 [Leptospira interrogans str. HAI1594]|nr:hypothetical protein LEP1GSC173_2294 [Leptospira interrogans str. HAI1594]QIP63649.1 hypothetical protein LICSK_06710 [Leptospira interrogans serovar Copenhageni]SIQ43401.1 hypothetical protein SAMN05421689_11115 [Leptospira interrogans]